MTSRLVAMLCASALAGCGLTLDLEPPERADDASVSDFGVPKDDGPVEGDGFRPSEDLGAARDLSMSEPDSGRPGMDGGPRDMNVRRTCADGCRDTEYCETTLRVCLGTEGTCVTRPPESDCLGMPEDPVCGCDYRNYRNDCAAAAAGVVVALLTPCPFDAADDWCDLEPPPSPGPGCFPCYDDVDCLEVSATATHCVGSTCSAAGPGRCAFDPPPGDCYYDRDCRPDETCEGAILYGCDDPGGITPVQGMCR